MAVLGTDGPGFAAAAGVIALLGPIGSGGATAALIRAVRTLHAAIGSILLITVLDTAIPSRIYRRHPGRPRRRAEILGEFKAHAKTRRHNDPPARPRRSTHPRPSHPSPGQPYECGANCRSHRPQSGALCESV
jgi:hypothetical protein